MDISQIDLARASHYLAALPSDFEDVTVTNVATAHDLDALGLSNKRVFMLAIGADITILRGDRAATLTAGNGLVVPNGDFSQAYFLTSSTDTPLEITVVAGSAGPHTLRIFYGD